MDINVKVNLEKLAILFSKCYDKLYNSENEMEYDKFTGDFDIFAHNNPDVVGEFCKYRKDFISSDREAAAFMIALYYTMMEG